MDNSTLHWALTGNAPLSNTYFCSVLVWTPRHFYVHHVAKRKKKIGKMQADKLKKELSIVGACSTHRAVSLWPVNQPCNMTDGHHWDRWPLPWFCYLQITKPSFLDSLRTIRQYGSQCLSPSQLSVTVIRVPLSFSLTSFLTLHNLWGSLSYRPIILSSGDPVMRGSPQRRHGHHGDHKSAFMERLPTHADAECAIRVHSGSEVKMM